MGSSKTKLEIISLALVALLLTSVLGLAVPSITVNVQGIGTGSSSVVTPVCIGGYYLANNGIMLQFASALPNDTRVYVTLYDSNGDFVASNSVSFPDGLAPNTRFLVQFPSNDLSNSDIGKTHVTVVDGYGNVLYSGTIGVSVQKIGWGNWTGELAQPINITYNGSKTLENWPVKIILSNNNPENPYGSGYYYIYWPLLQDNIQSIHFFDSQGHLLYYWIEIFHPGTYPNYDDAYAVIWVNVTEIPHGGTTIWMVYGSGDYSQYNSGYMVFPFFDDFEVWSGWTQYGNGIVRQTTDNFEYGGSYAAEKTSYNDPNGAYKNIGRIFNRSNQYGGLILEYWDNRYQDTGGNLDRVGLIDDSGNGYGAVLNAIRDQIRIDVRSNYGGSTYARKNVDLNTNTWYFVRFEIISDGTLVMKVYDTDGNLLASTSYADSAYSSFSRVYIFGGQTYHIDDVRVRYYTPNEPEAHVDEWYRFLQFRPGCSISGGASSGGATEYVIPITITSTGSATLPDYVVNFTYSLNPSEYSSVYFTDSSGSLLYYWYRYDPNSERTYFWVNVSNYQLGTTKTIYLHLNGNGYDPLYLDPARVFWYFTNNSFSLSAGEGKSIPYDTSQFVNAGYAGFAFDTNATLGNPGSSTYLGPYIVPLMESRFWWDYYYGVGIEGDANLYEVMGNSPSAVSVYQPLNGGVTSWNGIIYSLEFSQNGGNVDVNLYQNNNLVGYGTISPIWNSLSFTTPYLGQKDGGTSTYYWIGMRPYYPGVRVSVGSIRPASALTSSTIITTVSPLNRLEITGVKG